MPVSMGTGPLDLPSGPLTKGLKAVFKNAYDTAWDASILSRIATHILSSQDSEDYPWMGATPKLREFNGPRELANLANFNYNIKNKKWENTIGIPREDIEDDKYGIIKLRVQQLAQEAARYPEELAITAIQTALGAPTAAASIGYDGQGFFDTDHPATSNIGGAVQSNLVTVEMTYANFWAAVYKMMIFKDDVGRVLNMVPDTLLVEPYLLDRALDFAHSAQNVDSATANVSSKMNQIKSLNIKVECSPFLGSNTSAAASNWVLMCTKGVVKPLIFQDRVPVQFGSLEKESDAGFMTGQYVYGTYSRWNIGWGPWFTCVGSTGT